MSSAYLLRLFLRELLLRLDLRPPLLRPVLLRLDFLPPELLRAPPFLRPPLFAAAMMSLHDEVRLSPLPVWSGRLLHRVPTDRELPRNSRATTSTHRRV